MPIEFIEEIAEFQGLTGPFGSPSREVVFSAPIISAQVVLGGGASTSLPLHQSLIALTITTLTPRGRLLPACCVVTDRWSLRRAAERFSVSVNPAKRWRPLGLASQAEPDHGRRS